MIDGARRGHPGAVNEVEVGLLPRMGERASGVEVVGPAVHAGRLRALVDAHIDFIWRSLRRLGLSSADADDGVQSVFLVAARKLDVIEVGRERAYLFSVAQRVAHDVRRAASRRPETVTQEVDAADPAPGPEEFADRRRARALLDQVLDGMPPEVRTVFVLFELEEMSAPDIAALIGVPLGTVASRLRRGREIFHAAAARVQARAAFHGGGP
jgi:RNA polymerase sigma-70 factor (ECF subfamily)